MTSMTRQVNRLGAAGMLRRQPPAILCLAAFTTDHVDLRSGASDGMASRVPPHVMFLCPPKGVRSLEAKTIP